MPIESIFKRKLITLFTTTVRSGLDLGILKSLSYLLISNMHANVDKYEVDLCTQGKWPRIKVCKLIARSYLKWNCILFGYSVSLQDSGLSFSVWPPGGESELCTVNTLIFAESNFRGFGWFGYFRGFNFRGLDPRDYVFSSTFTPKYPMHYYI